MIDVRVLLVAAPAGLRDKWADDLQRAGCAISGLAGSSQEALQQIEASRPDLVLIELNGTGELDGVDVACQIRSRSPLPLLYLVQSAGDDLFQRALASKPDGFVFDPSRPQELHAALELARENDRTRREAEGRTESRMPGRQALRLAAQGQEEPGRTDEKLGPQIKKQRLAAEAKLRAERERYADLFQSAPDAYLVTDLLGFVLEANRAAGLLLRREEAFLVNKPLIMFVATGDQDRFFEEVAQALDAQEPVYWEAQLQTGDGLAFQAALTVAARPVPGIELGERAILRWLIRDITPQVEAGQERERLLQENRNQREFLERLVNSAPVAIGVVHGPDHRLELCNSSFQALMAFAGQVALGEPLDDVFRRASPAILELIDQVRRTETIPSLQSGTSPSLQSGTSPSLRSGTLAGLREEEVQAGPGCEPGACFWDVDCVPLPGSEGADRVLLLINQVTGQVWARHKIEELAARAEQKAEELDAVFAAMADTVVVYDDQARATRANTSAVNPFGVDLVGKTDVEQAHGLSISSLDGKPLAVGSLPVARALRGEAVHGQHLVIRNAEGKEQIIRASAGPVRTGGQTTGAVATFHDITEEVGLQRARDRLVAILEATPDMVFIFDPAGSLLYMNQAARRARGLTDDLPLDGLTYRDMLPAEAAALVGGEGIPTALRDGIWRGQAAIAGVEGREIPVSKVILAHRGSDGQVDYLSSIARDVTERQRILAELAGERARLRAVIDNAPEGIVLADAEGKVLLANPAAERLYAPLAGGPLPGSHEFDSLASLGLRHADGSPFGPAAQAPPAPRSALNGETLVDQALRIPRPGGEQRDLIANSAPIRDSQGRVTGSVTIFRDVTEQVRAQENLRRFSDRLRILYDIDQAILAAQTPEEIFPPVLQRLAQLVPCCYAGILLSMPDTGLLQLRLGDEQGSHQVLDDVGLTVADLANHRLRQVGNLQSVPDPSPLERLFSDRGLRAFAGAPVQAGNTLLGFLFIGSDEPHSLHPESVQIVGDVARSLALAVQHDLLRTELLRHSEQLAASLREKELMLQEIHHRVKNNLQIISSLLDMEAAGIPDPSVAQVLQDSRSRVKIMALIHERLYQSTEVGSVAAPGFVRTIASYLLGMHRPTLGPVDLELDVQEVFLGINTAIPLGLILNELMSNALRHAFAAQEGERGMSFPTPGHTSPTCPTCPGGRCQGGGRPVPLHLLTPDVRTGATQDGVAAGSVCQGGGQSQGRDGATAGKGKSATAGRGKSATAGRGKSATAGRGKSATAGRGMSSTAGRGKVRVTLAQDGDQMVLEVSDNGVGLPEAVNWQAPSTLGLKLVRVLAEQLRGTVHLDTGPSEGKVPDPQRTRGEGNVPDRREGKTFRIAFPWPGPTASRG